MRFFSTAGPVVPNKQYCIPPLERLPDLDHVLRLIGREEYFTVHAPRQTGKTSALLALQDLLNSGTAGDYRCVYVNLEPAEAMREDLREAMRGILDELALSAESQLGDQVLVDICNEVKRTASPGMALRQVLFRWARADARPLVLLIDEIDSLEGDTLTSILRQLRSGYYQRPTGFPQSIVLCGLRDVGDYRIHSSSRGKDVPGGSVFNISATSLRLGDFSEAEVIALLDQHTTETGQTFEPGAVQRIWKQTCGQPWLVNALCDRACFPKEQGLDWDRPVTDEEIAEAQEQIILARAVHLDQLAAKLVESRVQRVVEPLLSGEGLRSSPEGDLVRSRDLEYVRDLGLIARDDPPRIANPIYMEVIPRELTAATQEDLPMRRLAYINADGSLNAVKLLADFQDFFRQNSEHWLKRIDYPEAAPQLLLQACLQRVINGGGRIDREFGVGRGRTDVMIFWPTKGGVARYVIECKLLRGSLETTISRGLEQTAAYMDTCGAVEGHLVIFDRSERSWTEKVFRRDESVGDAPIIVWGM